MFETCNVILCVHAMLGIVNTIFVTFEFKYRGTDSYRAQIWDTISIADKLTSYM